MSPSYELRVNGERRVVEGRWIGETLLDVLRDHLGLAGTKNGCEEGECGSCTVKVDGDLVCACLVLGAAAAGREVQTIEGHGTGPGLSVVQAAFLQEGAVQCGFCTPGLVVAVEDLLARNPAPTPADIREALAGNLCRCTGYGRIVAAVEAAADAGDER